MREIKFRGKRVDNGEWVFGYYLSYGVDVYSCGEIIGTKDEHYIVTPCHEDFSYEHTFEVRKETLCQYTGLKNKYEVEIYEGDILEEQEGYYFEVIWDEKCAKFKLQWKNKAYQYPEWNRGTRMKIIGNIYDNPELIG